MPRFIAAAIGLIACAALALAAGAAELMEFKPSDFRSLNGKSTQAETATLVVPERHGAPTERTLSLPVLRFRAKSPSKLAPIIYLAGGPGGSGLYTARSSRFVLFQDLAEVTDVVTFDQRGTGGASPKLHCTETIKLPLDRPGNEQEELAAQLEPCRRCAEKLRAAGHDLAAYNTVESAHDIERLRIALGVEKISLWGTSYGTHLSLAYARLYPARVERLVLVGVEGPDHTYKLPSDQDQQLARIADWVRGDSLVAAAIPDFVALVRDVLARVEREPVVIDFKPFGSQKTQLLAISKWDLQVIAANGIGRTRTARKLPALFYAMSQGNFSAAAPLVSSRRTLAVGPPMSYLMDGASGATPERLARIHREAADAILGDAINFPFPAIDAAWQPQDLGDTFRGPLVSDVPALLVSGSLDGRTPPTNAAEILQGFRQGSHVIVEGVGHDEDLFSQSPELRRRIVEFVAGKPVATDPIRVEPPQLDWPGRK